MHLCMLEAMELIGIYGAGGFAGEVAWLLSECHNNRVAGYIDDAANGQREIHGLPVMSWDSFRARYPAAIVTIAIAKPCVRERLSVKCSDAGFAFATVVHPSVKMSGLVQVGAGSIICAGSVLTVDIEVGKHVHINLNCTVGHDVRIGDYTTLAPGVHVSGNVHIGRGVTIGTGATIINGAHHRPIVIGDGAVIGAGACVTKNVEPACLYAGVPAVLKKRY
jgi:sugar O-acyltransferase (sialic acid O-acetyltransferase NeuD family)